MTILQLIAVILLTAYTVAEKGDDEQRTSSTELSNTEIVEILSDPTKVQYLREHTKVEVNPRVLLVNILEERNYIRSKFKEDIVNRQLREGMNKEEIMCILGEPYDWRESWTTPAVEIQGSSPYDTVNPNFSYKKETLYFKLSGGRRIQVSLVDGIAREID
jgi:hypothetical protein